MRINKKGYNFINVITVLFIASLLSLMTFQLIYTSLNNYSLNEKYFISNTLCENEINLLIAKNSFEQNDKTINIDNTDYKININVEKTEEKNNIKVTVSFTYKNKSYFSNLETVCYEGE